MVNLKIKLFLLFSLMGAIHSTSQAETFAYRLKPVSLSYTSEGSVNATFGIACNGTFMGMAFFPGINRQPLRIGAVERIGTKICAGFERTLTFGIKEIDASSYMIRSVSSAESGQKVLFYNIEQIRLVPLTDHHSLLQVSYATTCRPPTIGLMLARRRDIQKEVAIVSLYPKTSKEGLAPEKDSCPAKVRVVNLNLETHGQDLTVDPMNIAPDHLENAFHLKSTAIDPSSLRASATSGISFKYLRRCNEAPIGMAISGKADGTMGINMVVASYYNDPCLHTSPHVFFSSYSVNNFAFDPTKIFMEGTHSSSSQQVHIVRPIQYTAKTPRGIELRFIDGCQTSRSVIVGDNGNQEVFLGVLQNIKAKECKNKLTEVSWYLPNVKLRGTSKVRPLALWGTI